MASGSGAKKNVSYEQTCIDFGGVCLCVWLSEQNLENYWSEKIDVTWYEYVTW